MGLARFGTGGGAAEAPDMVKIIVAYTRGGVQCGRRCLGVEIGRRRHGAVIQDEQGGMGNGTDGRDEAELAMGVVVGKVGRQDGRRQ